MKPLTNETLIEEPTEKDIESPLFKAIWKAIKGWDLERERGLGYAGATGTDVKTILNAIKPALQAKEDDMVEKFKEMIGEDEKLTIVGHKYATETGEIEKYIGDGEEEWKVPRNELRAELRSKLSNLSDK